jgi:hypothetical protein
LHRDWLLLWLDVFGVRGLENSNCGSAHVVEEELVGFDLLAETAVLKAFE